MINLRYHIVSITAVFLALGIGITMGSTFLGRTALDRIDANVDQARRERDATRTENARLRKAVTTFEERGRTLSDEGAKAMFESELTGVPVLVIAAPGVDRTSLDNLEVALQGAGAVFDGTLVLSDKLARRTASAEELANVLGRGTGDVVQLRSILIARVSTELMAAARVPTGPSPTTRVTGTTLPSPGGTTTTTEVTIPGFDSVKPPPTISALVKSGLAVFRRPGGGSGSADLLVVKDYRYVVVTGPTPDLPDADFVVPLLQAMTADGPAPVVLASAATGDDPEAVRDTAFDLFTKDVRDRLSTVDDLEDFSGVAASVLAVKDLGVEQLGHYGYGKTAKSLLPTPEGS